MRDIWLKVRGNKKVDAFFFAAELACLFRSLIKFSPVRFDRFVPQSFYAPRSHKGVARATPSSREMI